MGRTKRKHQQHPIASLDMDDDAEDRRETAGGMKLRAKRLTGRRAWMERRSKEYRRRHGEDRDYYEGGQIVLSDDEDDDDEIVLDPKYDIDPDDVERKEAAAEHENGSPELKDGVEQDDDDWVVVPSEQSGGDDYGREEQNGAAALRHEVSSLEDLERACRVNAAYVDMLMRVRDHVAARAQDFQDSAGTLQRLGEQLVAATRQMEDMFPVAQTGPVERALPPHLPEADGSEVRFTDAAAKLGIRWSRVDQDTKFQLYERAAELHKQCFGARPRRVRMWTNQGYKPVYYYNQETYGPTVMRALQEYLDYGDEAGK